MRKQTKLVAVLSAAALLAIGASMTSFAATPHWDMEDGEWIYLDRNEDKVAGEWKKSNGQWYYLDEDGFMAKDTLVDYNDDRFYVDANGVKVTNAWVALDNEDLVDNDEIDTVWFYFNSKGKAIGYNDNDGIEGEIQSLPYGNGQTGYFIFDENGVMASGWTEYNGNNYYLGDENEGWARTGWQWLDTDAVIFDEGDDDGNPYEDEAWFYFDGKGKAQRNKTKKIGGRWYAFNKDGVMQDLWVYDNGTATESVITANGGTSTASDAAYYQDEVGARDTNWIRAYKGNDDEDYTDDMYWFYLDSHGKPVMAGEDDGIAVKVGETKKTTVAAKSIKNKTYLFADDATMKSGLYTLTGVKKGSRFLEDGIYFFSTDDGSVEGQLVTNKKIVVNIDDEDETYYLSNSGKAYTNTIISGSLYGENGQLVNNYGDGSTYEPVLLDDVATSVKEKGKTSEIPAGSYVLLNENGKIKKTGSVTIDGYKFTVKNYVIELDAIIDTDTKKPVSIDKIMSK